MKNKKQGVALIWALVLSAILLIISATMVSYIVQESQFSVRITESTTAYSYAKSGIEWANYCLINENASNCNKSDFDLDNNSSTQDLIVEVKTGDCSGGTSADYCISSKGISGGVTRKLEHELKPKVETPINLYGTDPGNIKIAENNTESFEMSFRFWGSHSTYFGLNPYGEADNPSTTSSYLAMRIQVENMSDFSDVNVRNDNVVLEYKGTKDGSPVSNISETLRSDDKKVAYDLFSAFDQQDDDGDDYPEPLDFDNVINRRTPYEYKVTIKYIKDTAASIKVCRSNDANGDGNEDFPCLGGTFTDLNGVNLGNLNSLFVYDSGFLEGATAVNYTYKEYSPGSEPEWAGDGSIILGRPTTCPDDSCPPGSLFWIIYDNITLSGVEVSY